LNPAVFASQKVIVINPGHSVGYDSGAVNSSTGITEAQVNQDLAGVLVQKLEKAGYKVYLTHTTDSSLSKYALGTAAMGNSLASVNALANSVNPDLVISIHHNSGGSSASGYELYWSSYRDYDASGVYTASGLWSDGSTAFRDSTPCWQAQDSQTFAQLMENAFSGSSLSHRQTVERDDYLPAHSNAPCILYEGGFISNASESSYLNSSTYREDASNRFLNAINEFFGQSAKDTTAPVISSVSTSLDSDTTTDAVITVKVSGVSDDSSGVSQVYFPVWTEKNGQDDLKWYKGVDNGNGNWSAQIDIADHNSETGKYICQAYVYDNAGNYSGYAVKKFSVQTLTGISSGLTVNRTSTTEAQVYLKGVSGSNVSFAVWTSRNDQDDLIWSSGIRQTDGSYRYKIRTADHNDEGGIYNVHAYSGSALAGATTVTFPQMTAQTVTASTPENGSFTVTVSGIDAPNGISRIYIPVWSENGGQDDLVWYKATKSGDNYTVTVNLKDHGYDTGTYNIHAYGTDNDGKQVFLNNTSISVPGMTASSVSASTPENGSFTVTVSGINAPNGVSRIYIPVWSENGGQDDLIWYKATKNGDSYTATVNLEDHGNSAGNYFVHAYGTDNNGKQVFLNSTSVTVSGMTADSLSVSTPENGSFTVSVSGVSAPNGVSKIYIPVWSEKGGQDDLIWYTAQKNGDSYTATVDLIDHNYDTGNYFVHAYGRDSNGNQTFLASTAVSVTAGQLGTVTSTQVSTDTKIMGTSSVTAAQLVSLYNRNASAAFPTYYTDRGVDLSTFAQMYIDEAKAEGVRADIAFAQAMHETGWLAFGGDVKISQFNFAGLGATGGGVSGEDFSGYGDNATGIRMGIRAQIQHLKAYASTDSLNNACVDNRFNYVKRGSAQTIGSLGGTWAADTAYATRLVNIINSITE
jgi:N-acetylmuramoyl-L-alanine amidase